MALLNDTFQIHVHVLNISEVKSLTLLHAFYIYRCTAYFVQNAPTSLAVAAHSLPVLRQSSVSLPHVIYASVLAFLIFMLRPSDV